MLLGWPANIGATWAGQHGMCVACRVGACIAMLQPAEPVQGRNVLTALEEEYTLRCALGQGTQNRATTQPPARGCKPNRRLDPQMSTSPHTD